MLRSVAATALLAAHIACSAASAAPVGRCRAGFVAVKTDFVKSITYQGIAEVRGQGIFFETQVRAVDKAGRSFYILLSSTDLTALSRLVDSRLLGRAPAVCARVDPTSINAKYKMVAWSSLTARYGNYEVDTAQAFPR